MSKNDEIEILQLIKLCKEHPLKDLRAILGVTERDRTVWNKLLCDAMQWQHNHQLIRFLIEAGADVNSFLDSEGRTLLMGAVKKTADPTAIKMLIDAGANVNAKMGAKYASLSYQHYLTGWTPLMHALENDAPISLVKLLLDAGADVTAETSCEYSLFGFTNPIRIAAEHTTCPEIISLLVNAGTDFDAEDNEGFTPLIIASRLNANHEVVQILISEGSDINSKSKNGTTPLMASTLNENVEVMKCLISAGTNIATSQDERGLLQSALNVNSNAKVIECLLHEGVDVNQEFYGVTPLMQACTPKGSYFRVSSQSEIISLLIRSGAHLNVRGKEGRTALMVASGFDFLHSGEQGGYQTDCRVPKTGSGNPEALRVLLEAGADVNMKDHFGRVALDYAREAFRLRGTEELKELEQATKR